MSDDRIKQEMLALLPRMRRFAYAMTGSVAEGDDLVQATYERAIRSLDQWQRGTRLDSWMFRIAQNLYRNELRAKRVRNDYVADAGYWQATDHDGAEAQTGRMRLQEVRARMKSLPDDQREALILVGIEGLSYKEAAQLLELPIGTVASRVARARAYLAQDGSDRPEESDDD